MATLICMEIYNFYNIELYSFNSKTVLNKNKNIFPIISFSNSLVSADLQPTLSSIGLLNLTKNDKLARY